MEIKRVLWLLSMLLVPFAVWSQGFTVRDVVIAVSPSNGDTMHLAGTLTPPAGTEGKVPAVILITGSGAQNRDEELMGHRPFKVIAEYLSSRGYAVLRCDDRGVGGSTGDIVHATTLDFASDVEHQLKYLQSPQSNLDIDPQRIFLFGHSEGATVAAIVAARNVGGPNPLAGVAMLGGAAVDGRTLLLQQNEALFRLQVVADSLVGRRLACMRELFNVCDTLTLAQGTDTVKTLNLAFRPLFKKHSVGLTREQKQQIGLTNTECYGWALTVATAWMRTFLTLNPAEYIAQMRCPLLALGGEKDCQVPAEANLSAIKRVCEKNRVKCSIVQLKDINHLGQVCQTGAVDEYATLDQAPDHIVLESLVSWLDSVCNQSNRPRQ